MGTFHRADQDPWDEASDDDAGDATDDPANDADGAPLGAPMRRSGTRAIRRAAPDPARATLLPAEIAAPGGDGIEVSLESLYQRFQLFVWRKLVRPDIGPESAREIHVEVFIQLDREIEKEGRVVSAARLLETITDNLVCNYLRTRARRPRFAAEVDPSELPAGESDTESRIQAKEIVEAVLSKLPKDMRLLILWIDVQGSTLEEVAARLHCPERTVQSRHKRARDEFQARAKRLCRKAGPGGAP